MIIYSEVEGERYGPWREATRLMGGTDGEDAILLLMGEGEERALHLRMPLKSLLELAAIVFLTLQQSGLSQDEVKAGIAECLRKAATTGSLEEHTDMGDLAPGAEETQH